MGETDIILAKGHMPAFEDIEGYVAGEAGLRWKTLNDHLQQQYKAAPKIAYSICAGKPGWNVKYQKSGKSLCTLYPERESFIALVVVTLPLLAAIDAPEAGYTETIRAMVRQGKPFNGTLWLMIRVSDDAILDDVKRLLALKLNCKQAVDGRV